MAESEITTTRLQLLPCTQANTEALHRLWLDPEVRKYLWDDQVIRFEQATDIVDRSNEWFQQSGCGIWCIYLHGTSDLIGFCGFVFLRETPEVELLYGLAPEFWGQGLATEATRALLQHGFEHLGLTRVFAGVDEPNIASRRVLEKLGMKLEKTVQYLQGRGFEYAITAEDFINCPRSHESP